ncbi:N-lysine methyltransferase KMT5A-B-like [Actinia tenebrosa]|uniref:[histone H4]-lysine(20) N-methyltransferase n=1 Tax=Actinia tenebrosa TaxID=6105 RepID=A0A6P8HE02_ACTTE|nr:N-lysine methyltransferase KMT5A-B-like [Actinia tenebrosa]
MMPRKRNKTKKDTSKKTRESSQETGNIETCSPPDDGEGQGGVDSKIPNYFPVSPSNKDTNNSSESPSNTSMPTSTNEDSILNTDKEREKDKPIDFDEQKAVNPNKTPSPSKDIRVEVAEEQKVPGDGNKRPLKQSLLSPKRDSGSVPVKSKRKIKTNSSKGNIKEEKSKNSEITKYFPVRRSERRVKSKIEEEKQTKIEKAVLEGIEEGIEVRNVEGKGRGVFALWSFKRGDFVCEYHGEHIDYETAKKREKEYSEDENIGCYMYYFTFKNKKFCVDATQESGRLGRLLNHSINGNCTTKLISIRDKPYLILVAAKDIQPNSELLYDYGERNKDAIASHPWLQA